jgi:hypothetical protein
MSIPFPGREVKCKDEWLTPKYLTDALGEFDLDPCAPINPPWMIAKTKLDIRDDGLSQSWFGRVWCNPPYGRETFKWLDKLADHGNGIGLIFARTETVGFFKTVWAKADAVFFLKGRLTFCHVDGTPGSGNAGAPSCLILFGKNNIDIVNSADIAGKMVRLTNAN